MTDITTGTRADTVAEIVEHEGAGHPYVAIAVNVARNAVKAGESAHRALEIARTWFTPRPVNDA